MAEIINATAHAGRNPSYVFDLGACFQVPLSNPRWPLVPGTCVSQQNGFGELQATLASMEQGMDGHGSQCRTIKAITFYIGLPIATSVPTALVGSRC